MIADEVDSSIRSSDLEQFSQNSVDNNNNPQQESSIVNDQGPPSASSEAAKE